MGKYSFICAKCYQMTPNENKGEHLGKSKLCEKCAEHYTLRMVAVPVLRKEVNHV